MVKKICCHPGCNELIPYTEKYCSKHKKEEATLTAALANYSPEYVYLYSSPEWRKRSQYFLKKYPICVGCGRKATVVDHIEAHRGDVFLFNDENNWQPLCKECHDAKTRKEIIGRKKEQSFEYQRRKRNGYWL